MRRVSAMDMDIHQRQAMHAQNQQQKDFLDSLFSPATVTPPPPQDRSHHQRSSAPNHFGFPSVSTPSATTTAITGMNTATASSSSSSSAASSSSPRASTPLSSIANQLTMNMLGNMIQMQNMENQMVGMDSEQTQMQTQGQEQSHGSGGAGQYNQALLEQQFKLSQLQQLQQLQNQIFQQQIALITGATPSLLSGSTHSSLSSRPIADMMGSEMSVPQQMSLRDQNANPSGGVSPFSGLPTPVCKSGSSTELRPRDNPTMDYVSPMILNAASFLDSPLSPTSHHPNIYPSHSHSHSHSHSNSFSNPNSQNPHLHSTSNATQSHFPHTHAHTAPSHIAFNIHSTVPVSSSHSHHSVHSTTTSPIFGGSDAPPSSTLTSTTMSMGNDIDISPLTSPWLGATGEAGRRREEGKGGNRDNSNINAAATEKQRTPRGNKRPAEDHLSDSVENRNKSGMITTGEFGRRRSEDGSFASEPLRKKHSIGMGASMTRSGSGSPATMHELNQQQMSLTPLTLMPSQNHATARPQSLSSTSSPLISPTSPNPGPLGSGMGSNLETATGAGSNARRTYRVSRSVNSTPLLKGLRHRMGSFPAARSLNQSQSQGINNSQSGPNNINKNPNMGVGMGMEMEMGMGMNMNMSMDMSGMDVSSINMGGMNVNMGGMGSGVGVVGDTPSPVDLSMPPPPTQQQQHSGGNAGAVDNGGQNENEKNMYGNGEQSMATGMFSFTHHHIQQQEQRQGPSDAEETDRLLPVTPASIMKLGRLGLGVNVMGGMGTTGGSENTGEMMRQSRVEPSKGVGGREKGKEKASEKEKTKEKGKEGRRAANSNAAGAGMGVRTRKTAAAAALAGSGTGASSGLKTILPANPQPSLIHTSSMPTTHNASVGTNDRNGNSVDQPVIQVRKTSHKAAEQKRRDSLKTTFDDLRTLLPPIPLPSDIDDANSANAGIPGIPPTWPPRSSSILPGSLPPRGPPKAGSEGPNKGVSKLQLLICGNEYIRVLRKRVERRDEEISNLRREVLRLRAILHDMKLNDGDGGDNVGKGQIANMIESEDAGLDLERDLDAVEFGVEKTTPRAGDGISMIVDLSVNTTGVAPTNALGTVGEQPEDEELGDATS